MTTPDKMLVVRQAQWLSDGMMPVSIKILRCAGKKEPYEASATHSASACGSVDERFCVWHGTASSAGSCCSSVSDFTALEEAVSMVETRFPGAKWLLSPAKRAEVAAESLGNCSPCAALTDLRELGQHLP
jgi:hypothetical protein